MRFCRVIGLAMVGFAGCSGDGLNLAPAEGVVTLDGQPVADAGVLFSPTDPKLGPSATGSTDQQGHFALMTNNRAGAPVGSHRVIISKADPFGDVVPTEELEDPDFVRRRGLTVYKTKNHLPARYADAQTSNLTATVEESGSRFEFDLKSK